MTAQRNITERNTEQRQKVKPGVRTRQGFGVPRGLTPSYARRNREKEDLGPDYTEAKSP